MLAIDLQSPPPHDSLQLPEAVAFDSVSVPVDPSVPSIEIVDPLASIEATVPPPLQLPEILGFVDSEHSCSAFGFSPEHLLGSTSLSNFVRQATSRVCLQVCGSQSDHAPAFHA